jgi:hypothetical protein
MWTGRWRRRDGSVALTSRQEAHGQAPRSAGEVYVLNVHRENDGAVIRAEDRIARQERLACLRSRRGTKTVGSHASNNPLRPDRAYRRTRGGGNLRLGLRVTLPSDTPSSRSIRVIIAVKSSRVISPF